MFRNIWPSRVKYLGSDDIVSQIFSLPIFARGKKDQWGMSNRIRRNMGDLLRPKIMLRCRFCRHRR